MNTKLEILGSVTTLTITQPISIKISRTELCPLYDSANKRLLDSNEEELYARVLGRKIDVTLEVN